jgi:hypothetical protein
MKLMFCTPSFLFQYLNRIDLVACFYFGVVFAVVQKNFRKKNITDFLLLLVVSAALFLFLLDDILKVTTLFPENSTLKDRLVQIYLLLKAMQIGILPHYCHSANALLKQSGDNILVLKSL